MAITLFSLFATATAILHLISLSTYNQIQPFFFSFMIAHGMILHQPYIWINLFLSMQHTLIVFQSAATIPRNCHRFPHTEVHITQYYTFRRFFFFTTFSTFPAAPHRTFAVIWLRLIFCKLFEEEGDRCSLRIWLFSKSAQALFKKSFQGMWTPRVSDMPWTFLEEYIRRMFWIQPNKNHTPRPPDDEFLQNINKQT